MAFGTNFSPTAANQRERTGPGGANNGTRGKLQEAIKVLSLRLPKVLGAQSLAPGPLLTGPGSGGVNPDKALAMNLQQQMPAPLAAQGPAPVYTPPPMSAGPSAPPPAAPVYQPPSPSPASQPSVSGASGGSSPAQQAVAALAKAPSFSAPPPPRVVPGITSPDDLARSTQPPAPPVQPRQDFPLPKPYPVPAPVPSPQTAPEPTPEPTPLNSQQLANEQIGTETDYARLLELIRLANENPHEVQG